MKVKSIDFVARGKAEFRELDLPWESDFWPDYALLKTECTFISPGTEFANLNGTGPSDMNYPKTLGYSAVAKVIKTEDRVGSLKVGDRCLCYHSSHRKLPGSQLVKIEDDDLAAE